MMLPLGGVGGTTRVPPPGRGECIDTILGHGLGPAKSVPARGAKLVGGPLRILFAAIFEEGAASQHFVTQSAYAPPAISPGPARVTALAPASAAATTAWKPRPQTAEIAPPPSVTDHTTELLNKSEPEKR